MDPGWLSNAYLVADEEGGTAVFVDSGAPMEPLLEPPQSWRVEPSHVLRTHARSRPRRARGRARGRGRHRPARGRRPARRGAADPGPLRGPPRVRRQRRALLLGRHPLQGRGRRGKRRAGHPALGDGRADEASATRRASCPATPTRRRSAASGRRTRSSGSGAASTPRATSPARVGGEEADARRLVARLRRQGQGARAVRGRPRGDRRRLQGHQTV